MTYPIALPTFHHYFQSFTIWSPPLFTAYNSWSTYSQRASEAPVDKYLDLVLPTNRSNETQFDLNNRNFKFLVRCVEFQMFNKMKDNFLYTTSYVDSTIPCFRDKRRFLLHALFNGDHGSAWCCCIYVIKLVWFDFEPVIHLVRYTSQVRVTIILCYELSASACIDRHPNQYLRGVE